jgi:tetratricopeptide (TPR) repeat protein
MYNAKNACRALLLLLATVSVGAAGPDPLPLVPRVSPPLPAQPPAVTPRAMPAPPPPMPRFTGGFGAFLAARFAAQETDVNYAAAAFLKALAADPTNPDLIQQAFAVSVMAGRPEAERLAGMLPDNPVAALLLIDRDVRAGAWEAAEQRIRALPDQGVTQVLRPILLAWVEQGAGRTESALATLRPLADGQRFRSIYALHAAMIADLAGRTADAARLYRLAQADFDGVNLRLAQIMASWQARQGHLPDAQRTLGTIASGTDPLTLALPGLVSASMTRPVARPSEGIAEAYLELGAALRQQDATDFAMLLLRLSIDLRPDLTPARMLMADVLDNTQHFQAALAVLAPVTDQDPLSPIVRLNRAVLTNRLGHTDEALRQLDRLAHDYPDSPVPLIQAGDIMRDKSRFPEAVVAYDRALARIHGPSRAVWPLLYARGVALERSHQWPRAEADFKRALELAPDQPTLLNYLGYSWADQGINLPEARQMIDKALKQRPDDGAIIDSLGWVTLRQGNAPEALKLLEHAVQLQPEDATINGHLGDAYWAVGRKLEATYQWHRALTLKPDPEDAARIEGRLHEAAASVANVPATGAPPGAPTGASTGAPTAAAATQEHTIQ